MIGRIFCIDTRFNGVTLADDIVLCKRNRFSLCNLNLQGDQIKAGDKRILIVNGETVPYALARIPKEGENRGNLAAGGSGVGIPLSERDLWICKQIAPELKKRGILFAGIDVIGDYLTEINITSPTCIRELDKIFDLNISAMLMDAIETKLEDNLAS